MSEIQLTREWLQAYALKKALVSKLLDLLDEDKKDADAAMVKLFLDEDTKQKVIKIPGAEKVAQLTLAEPKPRNKVDAAALLEWCKANRPELVETVEYPAVEAWSEERLAAGAEKAIMASCFVADGTYFTVAGEAVEGVEYIPAPTPSSTTLTFVGNDAGKSRLIEAWQAGELPALEGAKILPQIGVTA